MLAQLDMISTPTQKMRIVRCEMMMKDDVFYALTLFALINYHQWFNGWEVDTKSEDTIFSALYFLESILSRFALVGFLFTSPID